MLGVGKTLWCCLPYLQLWRRSAVWMMSAPLQGFSSHRHSERCMCSCWQPTSSNGNNFKSNVKLTFAGIYGTFFREYLCMCSSNGNTFNTQLVKGNFLCMCSYTTESSNYHRLNICKCASILACLHISVSMHFHRYNHLKDTIAEVERELQRLHDPLQLNLPTPAPPPLTHTLP